MAFVVFAAPALAACPQSSQSAPMVVASASVGPASAPASEPVPVPAPAPASAPDSDAGLDPRYRACRVDGDCVAVPRAGCCHNGWKEAVASSQKDAYEQAFACTRTPRPICPMYIVRDARVAKCDPHAHLCVLVEP
jgi:hypothetical protein